MKKQLSVLLGAMLFTSFVANAQGPAAQDKQAQYSYRGQLVHDIVLKWAPHVQEAYKVSPAAWAKGMASTFAAADIKNLESAAAAKTFDAMNARLLGTRTSTAAKGGSNTISVDPQALGDTASDLVFVPVTPCRIFDTRVAGGAIAANSTRDFDVTAVSNYSFQGGDSSDCGGAGAAGSFAAAVINFTVVTPSTAGYITAYPYLATRPLAATVNYVAGDIKGNTAIVKLDQGPSAAELSVYSFATTHLVGDIVGYFINPAATAVQCVDTSNVIASVAAGNTANVSAAACPAGYTTTATNCESGSWQMPFVYQHNGICSAQNNGASAAELRASRTCCRVPGR